jgi:hypothetical protein
MEPQRRPSVKMWRHWKRLGSWLVVMAICCSMLVSPYPLDLVQSIRLMRIKSGLLDSLG